MVPAYANLARLLVLNEVTDLWAYPKHQVAKDMTMRT